MKLVGDLKEKVEKAKTIEEAKEIIKEARYGADRYGNGSGGRREGFRSTES